jgi:hypothetical protein
VSAVAVRSSRAASELVFNVEDGVNSQGMPVIRARRYANVKPSASDEAVYAVAMSLAGLQARTLAGVQRRDVADIEPE